MGRSAALRRVAEGRGHPRQSAAPAPFLGATPPWDCVAMTDTERIRQLENICHAQQVILDHHSQLISQLLNRSGIGAGTHIVESHVTSGMDAARRL
jgi:hypothetical protein